MKVLMFCHHPDVLHYAYRAFRELGHTVHIASESLTLSTGFKCSSVKNNKFEVVDQLFPPEILFKDMVDVEFSDTNKGYDLYWSMLPEITQLSKLELYTWFDAQMQAFLRESSFKTLPGIKSANHPDAMAINSFYFLPNWVDHQPDLIEKRYITQLITECNLVSTTTKLIEIKNKGLPVKIMGGSKCPDGFIRDIDILPYTSLLIHDKKFGVNCYAVCKALDIGIPVYMSRETKTLIGFGDLPDNIFLFSEEHSIEDAYEISKSLDSSVIQKTYRSIYTLDRVTSAMKNILNENFNGRTN